MVKQTKAEKAAIVLANQMIEKANSFYTYHKEIIDEYHRLQGEAGEATHRVQMIKVNQINRGDFDGPL